MAKSSINQDHSSAWVMQTWLSFILSVGGTAIGIYCLPVDPWVKGFMAMGLTFSVGSTVSLTKTQRDIYEGTKLTSKIEEAKMEKILAEHNSLSNL
jgi:hypothetical protein